MIKIVLLGFLPMFLLALVWTSTACAEQRGMQYTARSADETRAWQQEVRKQLFDQLHLTDLVAFRATIPLDMQVLKEESRPGYTLQEIRLRTTPVRCIEAVIARPEKAQGPLPAVVCIHGHQGNRWTPFDPNEAIYKCFGKALAKQGFVVISTDVGQHDVREADRTLMGERLWDCMRLVDYLQTLPEVDPKRIGCAGLSLGGEMTMWLGAMDERIAATVSAGFLTYMDQMEHNHCLCWKFDGLRERVDYPDIYALMAPRPLQCQNGLKEPDTQFAVPLAKKAMKEIEPAYQSFGALQNVQLDVHDGAHEIDLPALLDFLSTHLK
jgi:esterase/lipase